MNKYFWIAVFVVNFMIFFSEMEVIKRIKLHMKEKKMNNRKIV